jgi:hypothetical protein
MNYSFDSIFSFPFSYGKFNESLVVAKTRYDDEEMLDG